MEALLTSLYERKLIAILRGVPNDRAADTVRALCAGGIRFAEITFDQRNPPCAAMAIHRLSKLDGVCIGAGTVMTPAQVDMAADAGAQYIISPNVDADVIRRTRERGLLSIPGAFTPSEVADAYRYGADVVKLFPAGSLGAGYIRALAGPYAHIPLAAVGGVDAENVRAFLDDGCVCAGVGGNLVDRKAILEGRYDVLTEKARALCRAAGV